jgi:hypothetical protein
MRYQAYLHEHEDEQRLSAQRQVTAAKSPKKKRKGSAAEAAVQAASPPPVYSVSARTATVSFSSSAPSPGSATSSAPTAYVAVETPGAEQVLHLANESVRRGAVLGTQLELFRHAQAAKPVPEFNEDSFDLAICSQWYLAFVRWGPVMEEGADPVFIDHVGAQFYEDRIKANPELGRQRQRDLEAERRYGIVPEASPSKSPIRAAKAATEASRSQVIQNVGRMTATLSVYCAFRAGAFRDAQHQQNMLTALQNGADHGLSVLNSHDKGTQ